MAPRRGSDSRRRGHVRMSHFEVTARDGAARAGILRTAHGEVRTPAFMPVGTKGTVKSLDPDELRAIGAQIILGNTYHLHFRPGDELIAELGGLHAFSGWNGPILTDSGGFQVFSLRDTLIAVDDDGVTFRSVYDGAAARFTPELAARIQRNLGSDVAMCLDICPPAGRLARRAGGSRPPHDPLGGASARQRARRRPARLRDHPGCGRRDAPPPLDRGARRRSTSTATRSAGSPWARVARRCSPRPRGRRRSFPPSCRATSWASATPKGSCA